MSTTFHGAGRETQAMGLPSLFRGEPGPLVCYRFEEEEVACRTLGTVPGAKETLSGPERGLQARQALRKPSAIPGWP